MLLYSASPEYETGRAQKVWVEDIKSLLTLLTSFPCPPSYQLCESVIWCLDSCTRLVSALEELVGLTAPQRRRSGLTPMRTPAYISDLLFQAGFMSSLVRLLSNGFLVTHSRFLISVLMLLCMNIWDRCAVPCVWCAVLSGVFCSTPRCVRVLYCLYPVFCIVPAQCSILLVRCASLLVGKCAALPLCSVPYCLRVLCGATFP